MKKAIVTEVKYELIAYILIHTLMQIILILLHN